MPPLTATTQVNLQVNDSAIVIAPVPPPAGIVTYAYPGFGFSASGGSAPYTWKATGTLPPGLTLGSDGTVSGTPTQVGTFAFSVTVTDSAPQPMSSAPLATQIMISTPATLTLSATPAPPAGIQDTPYGPFSFSATGGYAPLSWSVTAPSLPPGLTLGNDGSLSGTPTQFGTFNFTVTVQDSEANPEKSSQHFTIQVTPPLPPTVVNSEPPTGTVGAAYSFQFVANGGVAPLVWTETGPLPGGIGLSPDGLLAGMPSAAGKFPITLDVTDSLSRSAPSLPLTVRVSLARNGAFTSTGSLTVPRSGHSATLLTTGKVLIAGGANGAANSSAELYDPMSGSFAATGSMIQPRIGHTATLLAVASAPNYGKVLIVGAADTTAELYDPVSGKFTATGSMSHARNSPTATLLQTGGARLGMVLVVGGNTVAGDLVAELYNPAMGTFAATGSTTVPRAGHTAIQLLDGRVLIAGGGTATAELYDPANGTFTPTGSMTIARTTARATRLPDGSVLVFGSDGSADLYNPDADTFAPVGSNPLKALAETESSRSDGSVLAAGGYQSLFSYHVECGGRSFPQCHCLPTGPFTVSTDRAELFGPESGGFTETASLQTARDGHTATVLPGGAVLLAGGTHHAVTNLWPYRFLCRVRPPPTPSATVLSSAELFK